MAQDDARAERIKKLKEDHPEILWRQIADAVGVSERSAVGWAQKGGISYANAKKLAEMFKVDVDWIYSGRDGATPDLMAALHGDGQLDRIERAIKELADTVTQMSRDAVQRDEEIAHLRRELRTLIDEPRRGARDDQG